MNQKSLDKHLRDVTKPLGKKKPQNFPKFMYTIDGQHHYIDGRPVSLDEFIARDGFRKADNKKTKELDWEQPLRDRVAFIGNEIPEYFTTDKRSKTVYLGCPNDLIKDYKRLATQQRTELLDEIKKIICEIVHKDSCDKFDVVCVDDDGCFVEISDIEAQCYNSGAIDQSLKIKEKLNNLLNKKDE